MQVVADNDSLGAVAAIRRIIESPDWETLLVEIPIEFTDLIDRIESLRGTGRLFIP